MDRWKEPWDAALLLIAALVVAALGTTGIFLYVNGVDRRAAANNRLVEVLVAKAAIGTGTSGKQAEDDAAFGTRDYLASSLSGLDALSDTSTITDLVALAPIAAGTPILQSQFGEAPASPTRCRSPTASSP